MRLPAIALCALIFIYGAYLAVRAHRRPNVLMGDSAIPDIVIGSLVAWAGLGGVIVGVFAP